jgi:hypothetical protein
MISIDISAVPSDKRTHPQFLHLKADMENALARQAWINAFCVHEAGHMTYFRQLGMTEYTYLGPRIVYRGEKDICEGYMASVKPLTTDPTKNSDAGQVLLLASKAHAAGGIFAKILTAVPDQGDAEDRENFDALCKLIEQKFPGTIIDRETSWKDARKLVAKDLRSPAFRAKAWKTAKEIQIHLFGY